MLGAVAHVGITVRDMDRAVGFYRDTLGLRVIGDVTIEGEEASTVTQVPAAKLRAVYLRYEDDPKGPPIELLHFIEPGDTGQSVSGSGQPRHHRGRVLGQRHRKDLSGPERQGR